MFDTCKWRASMKPVHAEKFSKVQLRNRFAILFFVGSRAYIVILIDVGAFPWIFGETHWWPSGHVFGQWSVAFLPRPCPYWRLDSEGERDSGLP
jgi:hypothetical protein